MRMRKRLQPLVNPHSSTITVDRSDFDGMILRPEHIPFKHLLKNRSDCGLTNPMFERIRWGRLMLYGHVSSTMYNMYIIDFMRDRNNAFRAAGSALQMRYTARIIDT